MSRNYGDPMAQLAGKQWIATLNVLNVVTVGTINTICLLPLLLRSTLALCRTYTHNSFSVPTAC